MESGFPESSFDVVFFVGGKLAQSVEQQGFTVGEVALGDGIEAAEEGAARATAEAVIDAFLTIFDVSAARKPRGSPRFCMSNRRTHRLSEKIYKKGGCPRFPRFARINPEMRPGSSIVQIKDLL